MSTIERLTITMPAEMAAALKSTVEGGEYASASEIVREALRDWTRKRDRDRLSLDTLREAIRIGDESGDSIAADRVFSDLRAVIARHRLVDR